ncbi:MAG: glutathione S-transferase family protein [Alphaproteobacteria bacterium]|nr:glutathione S-transferase family protein [Alphaproteobacteria bacterium]
MAITLYELVAREDRRLSPFCWRTRMALKHKGLEATIEPISYSNKERIKFSGQDRVPILVDGKTVVTDSWRIAGYLEDTYPKQPSLFGGASARGEALFINRWADANLNPAIIRLIVREMYDLVLPEDRDYFVRSREARFGMPLDQLHATRDQHWDAFERALLPIRQVVSEQPYICGTAPGYGDYIVFGSLQWPRLMAATELLKRDDPVYAWRERMLGLFDGYGRSAPARTPG